VIRGNHESRAHAVDTALTVPGTPDEKPGSVFSVHESEILAGTGDRNSSCYRYRCIIPENPALHDNGPLVRAVAFPDKRGETEVSGVPPPDPYLGQSVRVPHRVSPQPFLPFTAFPSVFCLQIFSLIFSAFSLLFRNPAGFSVP